MSEVILHEYWGSGACGVSFMSFSPILTEFLQETKVIKDDQFVLIQSIELTPEDGMLFQYDIHTFFPVEEEDGEPIVEV